MNDIKITQLLCNNMPVPLGIDDMHPGLSWQLHVKRRGVMQTAYEIAVAYSRQALKKGMYCWNTGKIKGDSSIYIPYTGPELSSRQRYYWQVRIWDEKGKMTAWSKPSFWEMGLLHIKDWQGQWIEAPAQHEITKKRLPVYFRRVFSVKKQVAQARLYATAHGVYESTVNGKSVSEDLLRPGWTSYHNRLQYQTYDITPLIKKGNNCIAAIVADGWWRGSVGTIAIRNAYGKSLAFLGQIDITYTDGSKESVFTGSDWQVATGPLRFADMKQGEVYDARREQPKWDTPTFVSQTLDKVVVQDYKKQNLISQMGYSVRRKERIRPVKLLKTPAGQTVIDFGQNIAGRVKLRVMGPAGSMVILRHGETLDEHGNFTQKNLQLPFHPVHQKVTYMLKGSRGYESHEPAFSYFGFRYVLVEKFPGKLTIGNFEAIALYTDMPERGTFSCSNPAINKLQKNILWTQKSNSVDIPTDCPHRERAGWTADAQVFSESASLTMDVFSFYRKWLYDVTADQYKNGKIPNIIPDPYKASQRFHFLPFFTDGASGWGDAIIIIPWILYLRYGDIRFLSRFYYGMQKWMSYLEHRAQKTPWYKKLDPKFQRDVTRKKHEQYILDSGYQWGEWLAPHDGQVKGVRTYLLACQRLCFGAPAVATAHFASSALLMEKIAEVLGRQHDSKRYKTLYKRVRDAYRHEFIRADGSIGNDRQADYVHSFRAGLVPKTKRKLITHKFLQRILADGIHPGTGFLSTGHLLPVLFSIGLHKVAMQMLLQESSPSWLYALKKNATTLWESWVGIADDNSVDASLNHVALGSVSSFFFEYIAGIKAKLPGYKHIVVSPWYDGTFSNFTAEVVSPYGNIRVSMARIGDRCSLTVVVPPNTTADISFNVDKIKKIRESGRKVRKANGIRTIRKYEDTVVLTVGSGKYHFLYPATYYADYE